MAKGRKTGGRKPGSINKTTAQLKDMILGALADVGGQTYLSELARSNPNAFTTLVGKVLPMTVQGPGEKGEHAIVYGWLD